MNITKHDLVLSIISGVLFPVAFVIPYAGILCWFLLIPFFMAIENKSSWYEFRLVILIERIANAIGSYWLIGTLSRFGGFPLYRKSAQLLRISLRETDLMCLR